MISASPLDLYFCQTRVSDGACALQSPQPCAKKNISTGLPRSDASDGAGAPMTFAVSSAGAGFPSSESRLMFLLMRERSETRVRVRQLAFEESDRRAAAGLRRDQPRLDFDRGAERDDELRLSRPGSRAAFGHELLRQLRTALHLRAAREPADRIEILGIDAGGALVILDRGDPAGEIAGRQFVADDANEIAGVRGLRR